MTARMISFRADADTVERMATLYAAWNCQAGEALKRAVAVAHGEVMGTSPASLALQRYDALCRAQYRELRRRFAEADLIVIANACRSWLVTPESIRGGIALEVSDYLALDPDEVTQLPPVDGPALVAKLQALTEVEEHALLWALDTAKARADAGEPVPWGTVLGGQLRGPASN